MQSIAKEKNYNTHLVFYIGLLVLFFSMTILPIFSYIYPEKLSWSFITQFYFYFVLLNVWYVFLTLYFNDTRKKRYPEYDNEKISVVIPCLNEPPDLLRSCIESLVAAEGNKEIIIIDDGSRYETFRAIADLKSKYPAIVKSLYYLRNKGKRHAMHDAVLDLVEGEFMVTVDSDTILDKMALVNLVRPLKQENIGAVSGDVKLTNETQNLLTRMQGSYYWMALMVGRKAESTTGNVSCCSGCLAAYRVSVVKDLIGEFVNQRFLNAKCTFAEDRHLTNLVLRQGYKVVFTEDAVSYTECPSTLKIFWKQQMRWKRGFIREAIYCLSFSWKSRPLLFFHVSRDLFFAIATQGYRVISVITLVTQPLYFFNCNFTFLGSSYFCERFPVVV